MNFLTAIAGSTVGRFAIRRATAADVDACNRIARQYPNELGWVRKDSLRDSAAENKLHVATIDGVVRGFVEFSIPTRGANKGYSVVYHLATERGWGGYGIGRNLLFSVPAPIRLKCLADNPACDFYRANGFQEAGISVSSSGRTLITFERAILYIWVQGGNETVPVIARSVGGVYGVRHNTAPFDFPFMVDIDWENYEWSDYLSKIRRWRPVAAMVADYKRPEQRDLMLKQVEDLRAAGVLRIMVCPKFHGATADIPNDCTVAVSVPTRRDPTQPGTSKYSGFLPYLPEISGRGVHLLGGRPNLVLDLVRKLRGVNAVVRSVDGNCFSKAASYKSGWSTDGWQRQSDPRGDTISREDVLRGSVARFSRALEATAHTAQPMLL